MHKVICFVPKPCYHLQQGPSASRLLAKREHQAAVITPCILIQFDEKHPKKHKASRPWVLKGSLPMQDEAEAPKGAGYLKVPLLRYETPVCATGGSDLAGGCPLLPRPQLCNAPLLPMALMGRNPKQQPRNTSAPGISVQHELEASRIFSQTNSLPSFQPNSQTRESP